MSFSTLLRLSAGLACALPMAHAALVSQTTFNPNTSTFWNNATVWGGITVESGNDYQALAGPTNIDNSFTLNGVTWNYHANVRDTSGGTPTTSQFAGDSLIMTANTRLLLKGKNGVTSTANVVLKDDSHIFLAADSGGSNRTATLAGTIAVDNGALVAIGVRSNGGDTLTISSTISGGVGSTMVMVLGQGNVNHMYVTGDYSTYAGTFYLGTPTTGAMSITGAGSTFRFASGSAPLATLQLETSANYKYDLSTDVSFGAVKIGEITLAPGTYDFDDLTDAGVSASFTSGAGTLTVIPETSSAVLGAFASALLLRRRRL